LRDQIGTRAEGEVSLFLHIQGDPVIMALPVDP
jgi:hypothetical protein